MGKVIREEAIEFYRRRYANALGVRWPQPRKFHKETNSTGSALFYYIEVDGLFSPQGWAFYLQGGEFVLRPIVGHDVWPSIRRADIAGGLK